MTETTLDRPAWSKSQVSALNECHRKFLFSTSKNIPDAGPLSQASSLKKIRNRFLWVGGLVHETVGQMLKSVRQAEQLDEIDVVVARIRDLMRDEFLQSKTGKTESPLLEHHFSQAVSSDAWRRQWDTVEQSLRWFRNSAWLKRLSALGPECWKAIDEILTFDVNGIKAYTKIDCAVEIEGKYFLIDWKTSVTGDRDDMSLQAAALCAHENWGAEPDAIQAMSVSLIDGSTYHAQITEETLMETHLRVEEEASQILDIQSRYANPMEAPLASDPMVCGRCSFQSLCFPRADQHQS